MSLSDLFWVFVVMIALQPMLRQRVLTAMRQRKIARIQSQRGTRVITLVHRQETMRLLGFPLMRYIDMDDSEEIIRAIHLTDPNTPIDIVLHTPGGLVLATLQIARALSRHPAKVTVFVPHLAMSGGTLIALAADEIVMAPHAVLGPIDPQIKEFPAASLLKVVEEKPIAEIDDETLILADIAGKATAQIRHACIELLAPAIVGEPAAKFAETLTSGRWTHDYPITEEAARELGLNVRTDLPEDIFDLMALYEQPVRATPTVEYLPTAPRTPPRRTR